MTVLPALDTADLRRTLRIIWPFLVSAAVLLGLAAFIFHLMSAGRAYVDGESRWSKAQKDGLVHLAHYRETCDVADYIAYRDAIRVPLGDRLAREALDRSPPDLEAARDGFLQGDNHPDDIDGMILLYRHFRAMPEIDEAVAAWRDADDLLLRLDDQARAMHMVLADDCARATGLPSVQGMRAEIQRLNVRMTQQQLRFSDALGRANRQLFTLAVLTMVGVTLLTGVPGCVLTWRIVTAHGRARREAEAAGRAKSDFLANMSHELRTPMNGIIGLIDVLRQSGLNDGQRETAELIHGSSQALLGVLEDLLDLSTIEAGQLKVEPRPIDSAQVVEQACSLLASSALDQRVDFSFCCDPGVPARMHSDPLRLRQIVMNLASNAVKFSRPADAQARRGTVQLQWRCALDDELEQLPPWPPVEPPGDAAAGWAAVALEPRRAGRGRPSAPQVEGQLQLLEPAAGDGRPTALPRGLTVAGDGRPRPGLLLLVRDNGIGITAEARGQLFQPFGQLDASTTRRHGGNGLGLVLTLQLVRALGGRLRIDSAPGRGSRLAVWLPLHHDRALPEATALTAGTGEDDDARYRALAGLHCLVVARDDSIARDFAGHLQHHGAQLRHAPDLASAERLLPTLPAGQRQLWLVDDPHNACLVDQWPPALRLDHRVGASPSLLLLGRGMRRRIRLRRNGNGHSLDANGLTRAQWLQAVLSLVSPSPPDGTTAAPLAAPAPSTTGSAATATTTTTTTATTTATTVEPAPTPATTTDGTSTGTGPGATPRPAPSRPERILVAEDNPANQKVIGFQLRKLGFEPELADDGAQALERLHTRPYDLLLTDLHMPRMDGYQLTQAWRQQESAAGRGRLPVIALTANVAAGEAERCRAIGMDDFMTKPTSIGALGATLDLWLQRGRPRPEPGADTDTGPEATGTAPQTDAHAAAPSRTEALTDGH